VSAPAGGGSGAGAPWELSTGRLDLVAVGAADLAALHRIGSDERSSRYIPGGLDESADATRAWVEGRAERWAADGIGYWAVRLRGSREVVGVGGVERRAAFWNLYYRLEPAHWGRGLATELARAGLRAAAEHDPGLPVVAWIHADNAASIAIATRLGLRDFGLLEPEHWDGHPMHCYADRRPAGA